MPLVSERFIGQHSADGLQDHDPNSQPISIVSEFDTSHWILGHPSSLTKYHGSVHPEDATLLQGLIAQGYHVIAAIGWGTQSMTLGEFTPKLPNANPQFPPIPMRVITAKMRWTILA